MAESSEHLGREHQETPGGLPMLRDDLSSPELVASRRHFIKSGLAAGSIVLSVVSRPAFANHKSKGKGKRYKGGSTTKSSSTTTETALTKEDESAAWSAALSHHPDRRT
jgi:hypothetical protein